MAGLAPVSSVEDLLAGLPPERAAALRHARDLLNRALPDDYRESVQGKMIVWAIPLERFPKTYNKQPLQLAALAAQKNHNALYLMGLYMSPERTERFTAHYKAAGKKLDMGKSCLRFQTGEDLCDEAITEAIAALPVDAYIAEYETVKGAA